MTRKLLKPSDFPMAKSMFDDQGIYASNPQLRSIALQVLEQERRDRAACRRAAENALIDDGGQWGIWNISDRD